MEEIIKLPSIAKTLEIPLVNVEITLIEELERVSSLDMWPRIIICELLTCVMPLYALKADIQNVKEQYFDGAAKSSLKNFYNKPEDVYS
jgi:hypothetical protein